MCALGPHLDAAGVQLAEDVVEGVLHDARIGRGAPGAALEKEALAGGRSAKDDDIDVVAVDEAVHVRLQAALEHVLIGGARVVAVRELVDILPMWERAVSWRRRCTLQLASPHESCSRDWNEAMHAAGNEIRGIHKKQQHGGSADAGGIAGCGFAGTPAGETRAHGFA